MLVRKGPIALLFGLPLTVAGCAAAPAPAGEVRVLVHVAQPMEAGPAIASQAQRSSGRSARYLSASGDGWHALALSCGSADDCDAAVQSLAADTAHFLSAQRDGRKKVVSPM